MFLPNFSQQPSGFVVAGERLDACDLKALLVTRGLKVDGEVYRALAQTSRLHPDPLRCNTLLLPGGTVVQMTDLSFHMGYLRSALSLESLKMLRYMGQMQTPFRLRLDQGGRPVLFHEKAFVTEVSFPPATSFYERRTASGLPFAGNAVLQGTQWVSFQCLWSCDFACAGEPCQYCYSGGVFEAHARKKKPLPRFPSPEDAAEIVEVALREGLADSLQLTGGSVFNPQAEVDRIVSYLQAIYRRVPRSEIKGEILVYTTAPEDPTLMDRLFEAGVSRVAASLEIWDEAAAREIMPGKMKHVGRKRQLACLQYIAKRHGKGRGCSNFIVGIEPLETLLEGVRTVAAMGIVPIASVWIPFGRPVQGRMQAPGLEYYRKLKAGLAQAYSENGLEPPGATGLNVCYCRDVWKTMVKDAG